VAGRSVTSHQEPRVIGIVSDRASLFEVANPRGKPASSLANRKPDFLGPFRPDGRRRRSRSRNATSMYRVRLIPCCCFGFNSPHQIFIESQCRLHRVVISRLTDFRQTCPCLARPVSQIYLRKHAVSISMSKPARYSGIIKRFSFANQLPLSFSRAARLIFW
jgi:hypothetical protein